MAYPMALELARVFKAEVVGLHVVPVSTLALLSGMPKDLRLPNEGSLLEFLRRDFGETPVVPRVQTGAVWERIVHAASLYKADLIVMATRGHDSLSDRILGSNTERVGRHAPCPVLVA
jgi:nucleotide-binding universal stress UspA family protein